MTNLIRRMLATVESDADGFRVLYTSSDGSDVTVGTVRSWAMRMGEIQTQHKAAIALTKQIQDELQGLKAQIEVFVKKT